jgi:hypothetical protein
LAFFGALAVQSTGEAPDARSCDESTEVHVHDDDQVYVNDYVG